MKASTFWGLIGLLILILAAVASIPAKAQDLPQPIVCRDTDYGYGSFVIRIPADWNNPDIASWSVLADGFGAYADPFDGVTFRADALTHVDVYGEGYPDWYKFIQVGNVLVFNGDYSFVGVYNQDTPVCDENDFPVAPVETATPEPNDCPVGQEFAVNHSNGAKLTDGSGQPYCTAATNGGVVGLPPATH